MNHGLVPYRRRGTAMKKLLAALAVAAVLVPLGCSKTTTGGQSTEHNIIGGAKGSSYTVTVPATATTVNQGEEKDVKIAFDKGTDYKHDVTFAFSAEKGITVEPSTKTIKANEPGGTFTVKVMAAKDAPIGHAMVTVKSTPSTGGGAGTTDTFIVDVKAHK
jgi:uncharacterized membrane protein